MPWKLNERGMVLGVVVAMSVVFAIAAFGIMTLSVSRGQTSALQANRLSAQYAAEAALVQAMQRLWVNPNYPANPPSACPPSPAPCPGVCIDGTCPTCTPVTGPSSADDLTDTVTIAGFPVEITVTDCGIGRTHQLKTRVVY